jgi:hypothetical protein
MQLMPLRPGLRESVVHFQAEVDGITSKVGG